MPIALVSIRSGGCVHLDDQAWARGGAMQIEGRAASSSVIITGRVVGLFNDWFIIIPICQTAPAPSAPPAARPSPRRSGRSPPFPCATPPPTRPPAAKDGLAQGTRATAARPRQPPRPAREPRSLPPPSPFPRALTPPSSPLPPPQTTNVLDENRHVDGTRRARAASLRARGPRAGRSAAADNASSQPGSGSL